MSRFDECLRFVLSHEGDWSNHPADPGGATMYGVIQAVYDAYRDVNTLPRQSVRLIGDDELQTIYREGYWNRCSCDKLPAPVDLAVFDAAVNVGPSRAGMWLQRALGGLKEDGAIGPKTLAAVTKAQPWAVASKISEIRRQYYQNIGGPFLRGWLNRVDALEVKIAIHAPAGTASEPIRTA